jgi:hypothetical protein
MTDDWIDIMIKGLLMGMLLSAPVYKKYLHRTGNIHSVIITDNVHYVKVDLYEKHKKFPTGQKVGGSLMYHIKKCQ